MSKPKLIEGRNFIEPTGAKAQSRLYEFSDVSSELFLTSFGQVPSHYIAPTGICKNIIEHWIEDLKQNGFSETTATPKQRKERRMVMK